MSLSLDRPAPWRLCFFFIILSLGVMAFLYALGQVGFEALKGTSWHSVLYPETGTSFSLPWVWDKYISLNTWFNSIITGFMMDRVRNYLTFGQLLLVRGALFVPLAEELVWRLPIWLVLSRVNNRWLNVLVLSSAALFTATHRTGLASWIIIFVAGLLLGFMVTKTKRFLPSVILHGLLNIRGF